MTSKKTAEELRLEASARREANWQRWGPYVSERQWGTVREDYSHDGECWTYFPHDHARSRAYRWGEDGLLGLSDRECRLCFAIALWNGKDPILKERLFGLTGPEGNHGEDVKECYYYLDSTPTHSFMRALYKYPQAEFPYDDLRIENQRRNREELEYEIADTGAFDEGRYFDVEIQYAKRAANDVLIELVITNQGPESAPLHVLPQLWFRNTWTWNCTHEGCTTRPQMWLDQSGRVTSDHESLGKFELAADVGPDGKPPTWLFTDNETNTSRHPGLPSESVFYKDAFHRYLIDGDEPAVNPKQRGTKAAAMYKLEIGAGETVRLRMRLAGDGDSPSDDAWFGEAFQHAVAERKQDADDFYATKISSELSEDQTNITRQAYAGLMWTKQFYHFVVQTWLDGDPNGPPAPESRKNIRNAEWGHLFNRDVLSMPDKWEYPWFAAWDSAFHMIPFAKLDPHFAREQLILFLREWYMHPNGQIPAYEWTFSDVNPPVHAWACWRVYEMSGPPGERDRLFLARTFQKLLLNFTWWINRKDPQGRNIFSGGFLGLDNIGVFDRSKPLPGGYLEQADATGWMAFYCGTMLQMALELADGNPAYGDMASKFFEHYVAIAEAMNSQHDGGLWDEKDGFYYDHFHYQGHGTPMRIRSLVGLIPILSGVILEESVINNLPGFNRRMKWFLDHKQDLCRRMTYAERDDSSSDQLGRRLLAIPSEDRLRRLLGVMLDETEFLSPYGIRSLSAAHEKEPFVFEMHHQRHEVSYVPGESDSGMFGGNSNWRGPIWMPLNYLIVRALRRYHDFYGNDFRIECPTASGHGMTLLEVAEELESRLASLFEHDAEGNRPIHAGDERYSSDPAWKDLVLFYEYFHGDTGRGMGASHQTGWTSLIATLLEPKE